MSEGEEIELSRKGNRCLNCERPLIGEDYCPDCGQLNTDRNITIWTLFQDFLGDYFSFDSKFFTTLIPLFIRPGQVPKEFIEGHRVKHIPPFRILIFSSFILFFMWGLTYSPSENDSGSISSVIREGLHADAKDSLNILLDDLDAEMDSLTSSVHDNTRRRILHAQLDSISRETGGLIQFNFGGPDEDIRTGSDNKIQQFMHLLDDDIPLTAAVDSVTVGDSQTEKKIFTQLGKMYSSDRASITKYFIGNLSLIILIIQPFLALLLKLIYVRRRKQFKYIGHLIFSFYFHAWILVLTTVGILIGRLWEDFPIFTFVLWPSLIYLSFAIKKFYGQRWGKTILKTILLALIYVGMMIPIFLLLSFATSFFFF